MRALAQLLVGRPVEEVLGDLGGFWRELVARLAAALARAGEGRHAHGGRRGGQRAVGPAGQAGRAAAVAAARRSHARGDRRPRRLPLSDRCADPRRGARASCARPSRAGPNAQRLLLADGYPAYTTTPGWLGYDDEKLARLCREAVADGFTQIKLKVGGDLDDDVRGWASPAQQSVRTSRSRSTPTSAGRSPRPSTGSAELAEFDPVWIEEPTSPDDILGHAAIAARCRPDSGRDRRARRTTASSSSSCCRRTPWSVLQIDATRVGGRQREHRDPAAGREVRRSGLPARRRRRAVRGRAAPVDVRLRRGVRHDGRAG